MLALRRSFVIDLYVPERLYPLKGKNVGTSSGNCLLEVYGRFPAYEDEQGILFALLQGRQVRLRLD
jgi:hypothetical protein